MDVLAEVRKIKTIGIKEQDIAKVLGFTNTIEFRKWCTITALVERKVKEANSVEQKKPWTGKVICIKDSCFFKKGKIYECKDGKLIYSKGREFNVLPYYSFDDLVYQMRMDTTADFIEYIE